MDILERVLTPAERLRARKLLEQGHQPRAIATLTGIAAHLIVKIEGDMIRDSLAGTGTNHRAKPPARVPANQRGSAMRAQQNRAYESHAAIVAHSHRCRRLPPATEADIEALKADFIARKGVTHCPTVVLDLGMSGAGPATGREGQVAPRRYRAG